MRALSLRSGFRARVCFQSVVHGAKFDEVCSHRTVQTILCLILIRFFCKLPCIYPEFTKINSHCHKISITKIWDINQFNKIFMILRIANFGAAEWQYIDI